MLKESHLCYSSVRWINKDDGDSETLQKVNLVKKKTVKLDFLPTFPKCTPSNIPKLWVNTCKMIRPSLRAEFSQNTSTKLFTNFIFICEH